MIELVVNYTVWFNRHSLPTADRDDLLRGLIDLSDWTKIQFNGKPIQAKLGSVYIYLEQND